MTANEALLVEITERKHAEGALKESYQKLQRALEGTIYALALTVEKRDPYTAGHQQRVTNLACAIAVEMGLSEEKINGIRMVGFIHDLGKIYVPAEILSKPGQLTEMEFVIIKTHAKVGYDILKKVEFPWPVAQVIVQHHERIDGSGYPFGLSGENILLEAKIIGVADVIEAIASHRPYRPALGLDKALEEVSQKRGTLYDPEVVDACLRLFTVKGFNLEC
jgi:putative nucleotidyltransferase with HDIG domain